MANDDHDNAQTDAEMLRKVQERLPVTGLDPEEADALLGALRDPEPHPDPIAAEAIARVERSMAEMDPAFAAAVRRRTLRKLIPSAEAIAALREALGISVSRIPTDRDMALFGYADETKAAIQRLIETSPVLEEAILNIASLCYRDGADSA
jgi:hypothetical protein